MENDSDMVAGRELARQLATLVFSAAAPPGPGTAAQAVTCRNMLARLGFELPLVVVADFVQILSAGTLFGTAGESKRPVADRGSPDRRVVEILIRYEGLLRAMTEIPAVGNMARRALSVDLIAVLLARLLGDAFHQWTGRHGVRLLTKDLPLSSNLFATAPSDLARQDDPAWALGFLSHLSQGRELLLARAEQLDLGPLRLLGMFPAGARLDLLELYRLMSTPTAGRAVDVSLQLLPSVLETKRGTSAQRFAIDGYASVERRGSFDAILPSELAHDGDVFEYKALSDELLYYGHERQEESLLREHWILVDASASMRGTRESFARGLAIALGKKLQLQGDAVSLRFFDSRLHRRIPLGAAAGHELPHILCFRSERGRHYARVFEELLHEARRINRRGQRGLAITFITHGECHIPTGIVESLREITRLYGIFVLPSRPLQIAYLSSLHKHQVVTAEDFAQTRTQRQRALAILDDVAAPRRAMSGRFTPPAGIGTGPTSRRPDNRGARDLPPFELHPRRR